jgi:hypothetical protein
VDKILRRFEELDEEAKGVASSKTTKTGCVDTPWVEGMPAPRPPQIPTVDQNLLTRWQTSALSLIERVFGKESATCQRFRSAIEKKSSYNTDDVLAFNEQLAIFQSAKSDVQGGYLFEIRNLVHAEVFTNELDQARHLLDAGYKPAAAVIAGTVLETTLRELCNQHPNLAAAESLNRMNDGLTREGVYNQARHRQIQAWADIRNAAAHGRPNDFEAIDAARMIEGIRDFIAAQLDS